MIIIEDGMGLFGPQWNAMIAAFRGTAVLSGCAASATGASRVISVTSGTIQIVWAPVAYAGGSVTLDAGSAFDRYDLITISAAGALAATKGTEAKKCPAQPANTCLVAIVRVPASASVIATGDVIDASVPVAHCIPAGTICMWSGSIANIPGGWALCNGSNGTPDLRGRFIVGAESDSGGTYDVADTGGEATHTLTTDEMPAHTHTYTRTAIYAGGQIPSSGSAFDYGQTGTTGSAGGGEAHENRPPFYALAYIMKLP